MSFYRKYRPQKLVEVVEQDHIKRSFRNALKKGVLSHAYLFAGSRGTGKTSMARIIARALNCQNPNENNEACNECGTCQDALQGRLVDLIEIDAASNRGIDEIRDLKEKITFAPSRGKAKVYIIDEVHMLTKEAFNALLKTLEEPPAHAYFILATTESHKVPETILSRCQRFDFHRIESEAIAKHLHEIAKREKIKAEDKALELIAKQAAGGMRDALGMLEQLGSGGEITAEAVAESLGLTRPQAVEDFVFALLFKKLAIALETIDGLVREGVNLIQFNKAVLHSLREIMLKKVSTGKAGEVGTVLKIIEEFSRAGEELKNAVIPQLPLEMAVVAVCGESTEAIQENLKDEKSSPIKTKVEKKSPEPEKELQKSVSKAGELSQQSAEEALKKILSRVSKPAVKSVLKQSKIARVGDTEIVIGVGSDFLLEKISAQEDQNEIADLLSELLGAEIKVLLERAEIQLAPSAPEPDVGASKKSLAEAAEELFGQ